MSVIVKDRYLINERSRIMPTNINYYYVLNVSMISYV